MRDHVKINIAWKNELETYHYRVFFIANTHDCERGVNLKKHDDMC